MKLTRDPAVPRLGSSYRSWAPRSRRVADTASRLRTRYACCRKPRESNRKWPMRHWRMALPVDIPIGLVRLLTAVQPWRVPTLAALRRHGLTLATLVTLAARNHPGDVALIDDDGPLTYAE